MGGRVALRRKHKRAGEPLTVLVVEPRAGDLERTRVVLSEADFRVVPVTRFDAAGPLFEAIRPDAVVLAAQAPDFAAVSVARRLRQMGRGAVPLLYLVDTGDSEAYRHCLDKGLCVDMVPRTGSGEELVLRLRAHLRLKAAVRRAMLPEDSGAAALHDPLTGLYNRTFLLELIAMETRRTERFGGSFSVVAGALDDFHALRKENGRSLAERMIVYSAVVFGQTVREADVVARVGEEEFAVLLPGTPAEGVPDVMTRVRERFALARLQVEGRVLRPSLALGAVSYPDVVGSPVQLLSSALQSLRRARDERRGVGVGLTV
ncbi:diguanylate cyclase [Vitiosangium sp. GDMCC 1.1324]|uniref:GGDEF domain-containing protein n=1 Tax=Vitiosangium sp. (strain GDMCC 1.1324) TaxID=2138576 RepID=UPI000D36BEF9|nr:diguanylate cyclase [Vitiosangium sp. GDMCC 1.1324]PTL75905.1 diguanylate cyclase response regulator [Vitiosangium sp. GDMCC 1.1324]